MSGVILVLVIIGVSAVIALLGDQLGRRIGRRRLSLWNLRPRYTATIITLSAGILIALLTFATLLLSSENVRVAMFGLEQIRFEVVQKEKELDSLQKRKQEYEATIRQQQDNLAQLNKEKNRLEESVIKLDKTVNTLEKKVEISETGTILFKMDQPIVTTVFEKKMGRNEIRDSLNNIISITKNNLRDLAGKSGEAPLLKVPEEEISEALKYLEARDDRTIVRLVAAKNVVIGETVPAHFEFFKDVPVFQTGEELAEAFIDGTKPQVEIEEKIKEVLTHVNGIARTRGVLPDPQGAVGKVSYSKIFQLARDIKRMNRVAHLKVLAKGIIYTIGPLEVDFQIGS